MVSFVLNPKYDGSTPIMGNLSGENLSLRYCPHYLVSCLIKCQNIARGGSLSQKKKITSEP